MGLGLAKATANAVANISDILVNVSPNLAARLDPRLDVDLQSNIRLDPRLKLNVSPVFKLDSGGFVLAAVNITAMVCLIFAFMIYRLRVWSTVPLCVVTVVIGLATWAVSKEISSQPEFPPDPKVSWPPEQIYIFIGNPGKGKTTIINGLIGYVKFLAKFSSTGAGVTTAMNSENVPGMGIVTDTPGLNDANLEQKKEAANQIEQGLKKQGLFSIFFVITLQAGRVQPSDKATIALVLEALKNIHGIDGNYSIIVNKVEKKLFNAWNKEPGTYDEFHSLLLNGLPFKTNSIFFLKEDEALDAREPEFGEKVTLHYRLRTFIANAPKVNVEKTRVGRVAYDELDAQEAMFNKQISDMVAQNEKLQSDMNAQKANFSWQISDMVAKHEKSTSDTKAKHEKSLKRERDSHAQQLSEKRARRDVQVSARSVLNQFTGSLDGPSLDSAMSRNGMFLLDAWKNLADAGTLNFCYYKNGNAAVTGQWETKEVGRYKLHVAAKGNSGTMTNIKSRGYENWGAYGSQTMSGDTMTWSSKP